MNLQVGPKPYTDTESLFIPLKGPLQLYPYRIPIDPFEGTLIAIPLWNPHRSL